MTPTSRTRPHRRRCSDAVYHRRRAALLLLASLVLMVFASTRAPAATAHPQPVTSLSDVVNNITGWVVGIVAGVATMFLTIGGLRYVLAGGDPAEVQKAKTSLKSAMFGYGLAILAPTVMTVLQGFVTGGGG